MFLWCISSSNAKVSTQVSEVNYKSVFGFVHHRTSTDLLGGATRRVYGCFILKLTGNARQWILKASLTFFIFLQLIKGHQIRTDPAIFWH